MSGVIDTTSGKMKSGKLYAEYCKLVDYPLQDRAYRDNMERLVEKGLVTAQGDGKDVFH